MNKFVKIKTEQINNILKLLEDAKYSSEKHDSTVEPFFKGKPIEKFKVDNKDLPKFPDKLNRHIKLLYELIGNPEIEIYIKGWTILSLNRALELYNQLCKDGQKNVFDIAFQYYGMGHIKVLSCDLENHLLFYRMDGGSSGWDREDNYKKILNYDKKDYEYMYFTQWMSSMNSVN